MSKVMARSRTRMGAAASAEPARAARAPIAPTALDHAASDRAGAVPGRSGRRRAATAKSGPAPLDDVRGRILNAAVKVIDREGLAGVSMREVARAAGVSHQAPYHYFEDREAILAALAEEGFKILTLRLTNALDPSVPAAERFVQAGAAYVHFAVDHPSLFRLMFRPDFVAMERFPSVRACGEEAFRIVPTLVQESIEEGLPAEPSIEALVVLAWSVPHGLACLLLDGPLGAKVPQAVAERDRLIDDVLEAMRAMLAARTRSAAPSRRARRAARR